MFNGPESDERISPLFDPQSAAKLAPRFRFVQGSAAGCGLESLAHMTSIFESVLKEDDDAATQNVRELLNMQTKQKVSIANISCDLTQMTLFHFADIFLYVMQRLLLERKQFGRLRMEVANERHQKEQVMAELAKLKYGGPTNWNAPPEMRLAEHSSTSPTRTEGERVLFEMQPAPKEETAWEDDRMRSGESVTHGMTSPTSSTTHNHQEWPQAVKEEAEDSYSSWNTSSSSHVTSVDDVVNSVAGTTPTIASKIEQREKEIRPYKCQHMRTLQERGFKVPPCPLCKSGYPFTTTSAADHHYRKFHPNKNLYFVCNKCNSKIKHFSAINRHLVEVCDTIDISLAVEDKVTTPAPPEPSNDRIRAIIKKAKMDYDDL